MNDEHDEQSLGETQLVVQAVQMGLFGKLTELITEVFDACQESIPDNPVMPHTILVNAFAHTLGQVISQYPADQQKVMITLALKAISDQIQSQAVARNPYIHTTVGHA